MTVLWHKAGDQLRAMLKGHSYWGVRRTDGMWLTELDTKVDIARAIGQQLQWYDDLVATEDTLKLKEIWLFCPRTQLTPTGATCELDIKEPGTAFQVKGGAMNAFTGERYDTYQIIGRLDTPDNGMSTLYVWDALLGQCYRYTTSIYDEVMTWCGGSSRIGILNMRVIGLGRWEAHAKAYREARYITHV